MAGVFRFSNAVSDIRKFIETYKMIYNQLHETSDFTHDQVAKALVNSGMASSSGAIGKEALIRSTRKDRSRDPLYNQVKMYSEIYRMLGWYVPGSQRTNFNIPEYGEYIFDATGSLLKNHFELNVLHIVSPNPLVEIRSRNILRPFPLILKILDKVDGLIHRDEIILTVLACSNDRVNTYVEEATERILSIRGNFSRLEDEYEKLMAENNINSKDVLRNYTRFVMATLKWLNYAQPKRFRGIYGSRSVMMYKQTEDGIIKAKEVNDCVDIRNADLDHYTLEERAAFTLYSIFYHLDILGYDMSSYDVQRKTVKSISKNILRDTSISAGRNFLYFGYQESSKEEKEYAESLIV